MQGAVAERSMPVREGEAAVVGRPRPGQAEAALEEPWAAAGSDSAGLPLRPSAPQTRDS